MRKYNFLDDITVDVPIRGAKDYTAINTIGFSIEVDAGNGASVVATYNDGKLSGGSFSGNMVSIPIVGGLLGCGLLVAHTSVTLPDNTYTDGTRTEHADINLGVYLGVEASGSGSASGVASGDYDDLKNKPSINGVTLSGDKDSLGLHIITSKDE